MTVAALLGPLDWLILTLGAGLACCGVVGWLKGYRD